MILYNTLMGVCAGGGMLLVANMLRQLTRGTFDTGTYGPALLALGIPLTVLAGAMTLTWPLKVNSPINIAFGEPSLMLGILMVLAGGLLTRFSMRGVTDPGDPSIKITSGILGPVCWVVFFIGLTLFATSTAIFSYNLVGDAPPQEPITGQATGWENTFFGLIYLIAAVGCLLAPWIKQKSSIINTIIYIAWTVSGAAFLLFSALNYRTHIGLLINLEQGTNYRW